MARSSVARLPGIDLPVPAEHAKSRGRWSPRAAWGALAGFLCCELALVFLVAAEPSPLAPVTRAEFGRAVAGPFAGLAEDVAESPMAHRWAFAGLMLVMALCYGVLAKHADQLLGRRSIVAVAVAAVVIVLGPPLRLTDAFNYLDFARLGVLHGLNPYVHAPADAVNDPFLKLASWHRQPTSYGPLFTLLTYPLALLGVTGAIWTLKALTVAAGVAAAALLGACADRLGQSRSRAVVLFGLNPIVLVYGLGGIHNDFFMVLGLIGAIYLVLAGRGGAGGWAAVSAIGLKASAVIVAPFVAVGSRRRGRTVLWMLVAAAAVAAVTLLVFGHRAPGLAEQEASITRFSVPHIVATLFGHGEYRTCAGALVCATPGTRWAATAVLAVGMAGLLRWTWRGGDWITCAGWAAILLILTLTAVMPWYLLWVLPLAILSRSAWLRWGTAVLGGFLLFTTQPFLRLIPYVDHKVIGHLL